MLLICFLVVFTLSAKNANKKENDNFYDLSLGHCVHFEQVYIKPATCAGQGAVSILSRRWQCCLAVKVSAADELSGDISSLMKSPN